MVKYILVPIDGSIPITVEIAPGEGTEGLGLLGVVQPTAGGDLEDLGFEDAAVHAATRASVVATRAFERLAETINSVASGLERSMSSVKPSEWTVEFNVGFSTDAGVVLTRAGTSATFAISLTWKADSTT